MRVLSPKLKTAKVKWENYILSDCLKQYDEVGFEDIGVVEFVKLDNGEIKVNTLQEAKIDVYIVIDTYGTYKIEIPL